MDFLESVEALEAHYGSPKPASLRKVADRMTPDYRRWIMASRFCVLSTVGPEGADGSPRGDDGPVVVELDERTLALPDRRGNDRIDSLRNIVRDPRVALMFMVPGSNNVIRINGMARVTADPALCEKLTQHGKPPRSVIVIKIGEIYFQCARALMRSGLWTRGDESQGLPTPGEILANMTEDSVGGPDYDRDWPKRAAETMW